MAEPGGQRVTIGYAEYVDLPDWGIERLRAKIDTGARTSSLHVTNIEELPGDRIAFDVVRDRRRHYKHVRCEANVVRRSRVRSSNGVMQTRYVVETTLRLGEVTKTVEVSLSSRGRMIYRMLLGRRSLADDFLIDAGKRYAATKRVRKKKKKKKKADG
jgi:hypothetical protein